MKKLSLIFLALLASLFAVIAATRPEHYTITNIDQDHGLRLPGVKNIVEDNEGVMWISSRNGVTRYNGQLTRSYSLPLVSHKGLPSRTVRICRTESGVLYAADEHGRLYTYNVVQDRFDHLVCLLDEHQEDVTLEGLYADNNNNVWMATNRGVAIRKADGTVEWMLQGESVTYINQLAEKYIISTEKSVYLHDPQGQTTPLPTQANFLQSAYYDATTELIWLGTFHQGVRLLRASDYKDVTPHALRSIPDNPIRVITPLDENTLIIGNDGDGLYVVSRDGKEVTPLFPTGAAANEQLTSDGIYDVHIDQEQNLWIASYMGGIDIAFPSEHLIETIRHIDNQQNSLSCEVVNDVLEGPDGILYFATEEGISLLDTESGQWRHTLRNTAVLDLECLATGEVMAATYGRGIYQIRPDGSYSQRYCVNNGLMASDYVYNLYAEEDGSLWAGCLNGDLSHIKEGKAKFYPIQIVQHINRIDNNQLAIGTGQGWYSIDQATESITHYMPTKSHEDFVLNISVVVSDHTGNIWLGTEGGGIYLRHVEEKWTERIGTEHGLPSNVIYALTEDGRGHMIASTDQGLAVVDIATNQVSNINAISDLNRIYMPRSICQLKDGRLAFGSTTGAVIVDPHLLTLKPYEASLRITRLTTNGLDPMQEESWNERTYQMLQDQTIELEASENSFSISFESVCYANQHDIQYQYLLEGYNNDWSPLTDQQEVQYSRVPSGKYQFCLRCVSRNDGHVIDELTLPLIVNQPWWNTWWAWLCYIILMLAIVLFAIWQIYEREHNIELNRRIGFFVHIAHDLRTPLSLIQAPLEHLERDATLSDEAQQYVDTIRNGSEQLHQLAVQVLDFNKVTQNHEPKLEPQPLLKLLQALLLKIEPLAEQKQIGITVDPVPESLSILADRSMTDSILDNLLTNALKYTPECGRVMVIVEATKKRVKIHVSDTGIGIPKSEQRRIFSHYYRASNARSSRQEGSGLGLAYSYNLAKMQGSELSFTSVEGEGSTFTLDIRRSEDLPVKATVSAPESVSATENDNLPSPDRDTLLFVDDNEGMRNYIALAFHDKYNVVTCSYAEKVLEYLKENTCDILVSDVMMPGMHGDELCRRIKDDPEWSWLPVVLLTANDDRESMLKGISAGADDYVLKPFDDIVLQQKLETLLANRRRLNKYYLEHTIQMASKRIDPQTELSAALTGTVKTEATADDTSDAEKIFIEKATQYVLKNLSNGDYNVDELCQDMGMSRTSFFSRLKSLTSQSPQQFIRVIRMEHAATLLREGHSIAEVSLETGFSNQKYFSTVFKSYFGVTPGKFS